MINQITCSLLIILFITSISADELPTKYKLNNMRDFTTIEVTLDGDHKVNLIPIIYSEYIFLTTTCSPFQFVTCQTPHCKLKKIQKTLDLPLGELISTSFQIRKLEIGPEFGGQNKFIAGITSCKLNQLVYGENYGGLGLSTTDHIINNYNIIDIQFSYSVKYEFLMFAFDEKFAKRYLDKKITLTSSQNWVIDLDSLYIKSDSFNHAIPIHMVHSGSLYFDLSIKNLMMPVGIFKKLIEFLIEKDYFDFCKWRNYEKKEYYCYSNTFHSFESSFYISLNGFKVYPENFIENLKDEEQDGFNVNGDIYQFGYLINIIPTDYNIPSEGMYISSKYKHSVFVGIDHLKDSYFHYERISSSKNQITIYQGEIDDGGPFLDQNDDKEDKSSGAYSTLWIVLGIIGLIMVVIWRCYFQKEEESAQIEVQNFGKSRFSMTTFSTG